MKIISFFHQLIRFFLMAAPVALSACQLKIRTPPAETNFLSASPSPTATPSPTPTPSVNLSWEDTSYDFGLTAPNVSATPYSFVFTNTGNLDATGCTTVQLDNTTDFAVTTDTCNANNLNAGQSCSVTLTATPQSPGPKTASLTRTCSGEGGNSATLSNIVVMGEGPALQLSQNFLDFGQTFAGKIPTEVIRVTNVGTESAQNCQFNLTNPTDFALDASQCQDPSVSPEFFSGAGCDLSISPIAGNFGVRTSTLEITCDSGVAVSSDTDGISADFILPDFPFLTFSPNQHDFGEIGQRLESTPITVVVRNLSSAPVNDCVLRVSGASLGKFGAEFKLRSLTCHDLDQSRGASIEIDERFLLSLAAEQTCQISVAASPSDVRAFAGQIIATCAEGEYTSLEDGLTTVGTAPPDVQLTANSGLPFGNVTVGTESSSALLTITNQGTGDALDCGAPILSNPTDFLVTTTCGSTLAASASCVFDVKASPKSQGVKSTTLAWSCGNGVNFSVGAKGSGAVLDATGVGGPELSISPTKTLSFGTVTIDTESAEQTVVISNNGSSPATGCSSPALAENQDFIISSNTCGASLANGASCSVGIKARPQSAGDRGDKLVYECTLGGKVDVTLRTTGVGITLEWTPTSYDFGTVAVGRKAESVFRLINTGNQSATCGQPFLTGNTEDFAVGPINFGEGAIRPGQEGTVMIEAQPQSAGQKNATLAVICDGKTFSTTTNGLVMNFASVLTWSPTELDFGSVAVGSESSNQVLTLTNSTGATATGCGAPSLTNTQDFSIVSTTCLGTTLANNATCTVTLKANPIAGGTRTTSLRRSCAVGGLAQTSDTLKVTGTGGPILSFATLGQNFGNVYVGANSTTTLFSITNQGTADPVNCGSPELAGSTPHFEIVSNTCTATSPSANGGTCAIGVRAIPQSVGTKTTTLQLLCDIGGTVKTLDNQIVVNGLNPVNLIWNPAIDFNFGSILVNQNSSNSTFTVTNDGITNATGCTAPTLTNATDFELVSHNCTASLNSGGVSCAIQVRATPKSAGSKSTRIGFSCTDGSQSTSSLISVTGIPSALPELAWSPATFDFGTLSVNGTADKTFSFQNSGLGTATGCIAPQVTNATHFTITSNTCGTSDLGPGQSCDVVVRASPQSIGLQTVGLTRTCTIGGTTATDSNALTVTGTNNSVLSFNTSSDNFGQVALGSYRELTFTHTNSTDAYGCTAVTSSNSTDFTVISSCSGFAPAGTSCSFTVRAQPTTSGTKTTTLSRTCGNGTTVGATHPTLSLQVTATELAGSPNEFDFGRVTVNKTSEARRFEFRFAGTGGAAIPSCGAAVLSNITDFEITQQTCSAGASNPSQYCEVQVRARPQSPGTRTGNLTRTCHTETASIALTVTAQSESVSKIAGAGNVFCVLNTSNEVYCADFSKTSNLSPLPVWSGDGTITNIFSGGGSAICLISTMGNVGCINGSNGISTVQSIGGIGSAIHASATNNGGCTTLSDGTVKCWGDNSQLQLGVTGISSSANGVEVPGLTNVTKTASRSGQNCALKTDNTVQCWGYGSAALTTPTGLSNITDIAANGDAICALQADGQLKCWGVNRIGSFGNGTISTANATVPVLTGSNFQSIRGGELHFCGIQTVSGTNQVRCWGLNDQGEVTGTATASNRIVSSPQTMASVYNPATQSIQDWALGSFSCVLRSDQKVRCWGASRSAQEISSLSANFVDFSVSTANGYVFSACVTENTGAARCRGENNNYQLGNGNNVAQPSFVAVNNVANATRVITNASTTCALRANGTVSCWGSTTNNGLGLGSGVTLNTNNSLTVQNVTQATHLARGNWNTCVRTSAQTVQCWGRDYGSSTATLNLSGISNIVGNSASFTETFLALMSDSTLRCWGNNQAGQCGNGSTVFATSYLEPVTVSGISTAIQVAVGDFHSCALLADGTVRCWGLNSNFFDSTNSYSPLGAVGTATWYTTPQLVPGITDAVEIKAKEATTCVKLVSGQLRCWGKDLGFMLASDPTGRQLTGTSLPVPLFTTTGTVHEFWVTSNNILYRETPGGPIQIRGNASGITVPDYSLRDVYDF